MVLKLNSGNVVITMDEVDIKNSSKWKTVESESYKPDKADFIFKRFQKDWPQHKIMVTNVELVYKLCSRSSRLSDWLRETSAQFVVDVSPPKYLQGIVEPKDYIKATDSLSEIGKSNKLLSDKTIISVNNFNAEIAEHNRVHQETLNKFKDDKIVRILNLGSNALPITLQLMIENFSPSQNAKSVDKKTYGRELLINFKISLIKHFSDEKNKELDIDLFLKEIAEK